MECPFPFYWAAALNAPAGSTTWWWPGPPSREPAADDGCVGLTALDLELVGFVYEVLVEPVDCTICGARLDPAISIQLTRGYLTAARVVVATHCRGWEPHRHTARVVERAGHLHFGQLSPD
jgi:hypothetical protein